MNTNLLLFGHGDRPSTLPVNPATGFPPFTGTHTLQTEPES
jgi:hypothetical protein